MAFKTHLEQLLTQVEGAIACSVMGFDGIAVETQQTKDPGVDLTTMLIEYGSVLGKLREATSALQAGTLTELAISTDKLCTIARVLTPEYYLVLALSPQGNHGKGRYVMRVVAPALRAEL